MVTLVGPTTIESLVMTRNGNNKQFLEGQSVCELRDTYYLLTAVCMHG